MGVVDREAARPRQAAQFARLLVAIDRAELGVAQRQIAIRTRLAGVDAAMVRAVHRPQQEFVAIDVDRRVLAVGVIGIMPGGFVQFDAAEVGRDHRQVAALNLNFAQPAFQRVAQGRAFWQPERQTLAHHAVDDEEIEPLAQDAMVALGRLFQTGAVIAQFLRRLPSRAINPRQLPALFIAPPIGAGRRPQRNADRLGVDVLRAFDMRDRGKDR